MKKTIVTLTCVILCAVLASAQGNDLTRLVDTRQGTDSHFGFSHGNTFPATGMPFGMHLWSPQTGKNGDGWKYQWQATTLRGLCQSHQCSPWVGDYAVYSLMPVAGPLRTGEEERATAFSHDNETARPHYYNVRLVDGTQAEVAPTTRGAHLRFSYPKSQQAWLVVDGYTAQWDFQVDSAKRVIHGWVNNQRFVNHSETFRCYVVMQFDRPFTAHGRWGGGVYVGFKPGTRVQVKVASSYISEEQAWHNLKTELGADRSLEQTCERGRQTWSELLGRVRVEGGTQEQQRTFYSCLFRANLFSRKFYDRRADGTPYYYSPYDGQVHDGYMFTDNGFWDTFRSQFPLTCLLHPTQQGRYMQALLQAQRECGWLPSWSFPGETGGMVGNHAMSLLADAWAKGIRTVEADSILKAYAHEAMNKGPWGGANGRAGWKEYFTLGYVPFPESHGCVTQTLEYAYDDFCAWQVARSSGNAHWEQVFGRQMMNYRNLWDASTRFMRGRGIDGRWLEPFDPLAWGGPYTEGNAWHYVWSVFQDVQGLINLFGSDEAFVCKIDSVFTMENTVHTGWYGGMIHEMTEMQAADMGQYAHGNQPIQHLPYLYCYAGQPWKTQYWVRQIMDRLYDSSPQGFPGDEDQGGMSAWYVLSALGLYAVTPGTDQYVIGSPLFPRVTLTTEQGRSFVIEARGNSPQNVYIEKAELNGQPFELNFLTYEEITRGGTLVLTMTDRPNRKRATSKRSAPFSLSSPR